MEVNLFLAFLICAVIFAIVWVIYLYKRSRYVNVPEGILQGEKVFQPVKLAQVIIITHDTKIYRFSVGQGNHLGLPLGQHIILRAKVPTSENPEGELVSRKYTPISTYDTRDYFDLLIKVYHKGVNPKFPEGGKLSQYIDSLKIGDSIEMAGPKGNLVYQGNGLLQIRSRVTIRESSVKRLGLIAGGTGITPIYQLIQYITQHNEGIELYLLFANKTIDDILLKEQLDDLAKSGKIGLRYTLDDPPENWNGFSGYITPEMIKESIPPPDPNTMVLHCGPPIMNRLVRTHLTNLGYSNNQLFKF